MHVVWLLLSSWLMLLPITIPKATNPYVFRGKEEEEEEWSYDDDNTVGNDDDDNNDVDIIIGNTGRFFSINNPIRRRDSPTTTPRGFRKESIENAMVNDHTFVIYNYCLCCAIIIIIIIIIADTVIQYSIRYSTTYSTNVASIFFCRIDGGLAPT